MKTARGYWNAKRERFAWSIYRPRAMRHSERSLNHVLRWMFRPGRRRYMAKHLGGGT